MAAMQRNANDQELIDLLAAADRFVFVVGRLCQRRSDTGDSEFYRLAGQLFRREKTVATVAEATQSVNDRTDHYFSLEKATTELRDLFQRGEGFYSWEGLRYFLLEYEQHLRKQAGMGTVRLNWDEINRSKRDHVTIEHIYPVSPVAGEWPAFEGRSRGERATMRNSLGNLLALSQSRNSKFSNRPFDAKKHDAEGIRGYFNGSYSEIAVAQLRDWTPESVLERGLEMLDFLEARWRVSLGSRGQKLKLLNLEFLEPAGMPSASWTVDLGDGKISEPVAKKKGTSVGLNSDERCIKLLEDSGFPLEMAKQVLKTYKTLTSDTLGFSHEAAVAEIKKLKGIK